MKPFTTTMTISKGILALVLFGLPAAATFGGELRHGVLTVDGKPFFPLGSWNFPETTPEDIARLGMNTSFQGAPNTEEGVQQFRGVMRRCAALGIEVVPYLSYGGAGVTPWPPAAVRTVAQLATEPNLLTWYVGDDITMKHLDGIRQTVQLLRKQTPHIATVADYIAEETPEARSAFTKYIDIRCQYDYPLPDKPYSAYLEFFDKQRAFVGDPLWTWVQSFMWGRTGDALGFGAEGPGPLPDPEQIRLLSFAAINRGVRGLLFFAHHSLHRLPELAAEVALTCRETQLVAEHLAAGKTTFNLHASVEHMNVAAYEHGNTTVLSAALFRPNYHRCIDEGVVENVTIDCPWKGKVLPKAFLIATPDLVECPVEAVSGHQQIRITIPRLELAGFVCVTSDPAAPAALQAGVANIAPAMKTLMLPAAAAQTRKVTGVVWQLGQDNLYAGDRTVMEAVRANERCANATVAARYGDACRAWRESERACRVLLTGLLEFAEARRSQVPGSQQRFLTSPYSLHNIPGLGQSPKDDDPWRFNRAWMITGPFPLEAHGKEDAVPAGFERPYPPETAPGITPLFDTVDGPAPWRMVEADISGKLDLRFHFKTTDDVVCYARCDIVAPQDMDARLSIGSNDGARLWVNGTLAYSKHASRSGTPHDDEVSVHLKPGKNAVLVKVENLGLSWKLYLSAYDPGRALQFTATP